jgi:hypothetical protein
MKFYYFEFEGRFRNSVPATGVFSSCIVPESERDAAEKCMLAALGEEGIEFIGLQDEFVVDDEELDPDEDNNAYWLSWHEEVARTRGVVFAPWQTYPEGGTDE